MANRVKRAAANARWHPPPDPLAEAADDAERLSYVAHAAKVKRNLLIRKARAEGATLRDVAARTGIGKDSVKRICADPEPELLRRRLPPHTGA